MNGKQLVALLLTTLYGLVVSDERIYGGYRIDIKDAPYMASITILIEQFHNGTSKVLECGGSILRPNLILTAAHCNVDEATRTEYKAAQFFVNVGTNNNDVTGGTVHRVKTVFAHPKFKSGDKYYTFHDIGLLELTDEITLNDRSQLVKLARRNDRPQTGADCTITGYGFNPDHPHNKHLYQVHMNVITAEQCVKELAGGTVKEVDKHQICVKAPGKNQCKGDSGGPLIDVSTNRQVGIVSNGDSDCTFDSPSILTRVTDNFDYIQNIIRRTTRPQHSPQPHPQINPQSNPQQPNPQNPSNNPQINLPNNPQIKPPVMPQTNPMPGIISPMLQQP